MKFFDLCEELKAAEVAFESTTENVKTGREMRARGEPMRRGALEEEERHLERVTVDFETAKSALLVALQES